MTIVPHRDLATLPYSSGTTGLPKGVMLSHHNLVANLCQLQSVLELDEEEIGVAVLPFFHAYGQVVLMAATLRAGGTLVTMPRFDLERFLAILQDYRVARAAVVPPIVSRWPASVVDASICRRCVNRLGRRAAVGRARAGLRPAA